jgi:exopolysaccharide biosynthesis polyprenyl glycosylphosphotransferase
VQIRLPWLTSRRRLIVAVLIDMSIFAGLYSLCFRVRYAFWPSFSLPLVLLMLFWLVTSYVHGRYYDYDDIRNNLVVKQLARSLLALLICMNVYLIYNWLLASALGQPDSRTLLLPFLALQTSISALAQFGLNKILQVRYSTPSTWLVLGDTDATAALQSSTDWARLTCELEQINPEDLEASSARPNLAGVVVSDLDNLAPPVLDKLLKLQAKGVLVLTTLGWCEQVLQRFPPTLLSRADLVRGEFTVSAIPLQRRLKRLGDVLVSAFLLLLTLPLLLLAMLLICLEDRGPIFYSQQRSGLGGEPFRVWKLRSMRVDAERYGPKWAGPRDPRITHVGRWLRLTRIDELPQLLAVITGQMSLIGPRPERPALEQEFEYLIPYYRMRYAIQPGLSGWAQVNYPYGASVEDVSNKLSYDLYYIRNFSIWMDLLIMAKTIQLVFNARGSEPIQ